jgi:Fe-S-cluster-containing dehydrogenase component
MTTVTHAAPTEISVRAPGASRMGFFTDTTVCIGCKSCEVACKQWNDLPADGSSFRRSGSYDHTAELKATTWRHVRFVEMLAPSELQRQEAADALARGKGGSIPRIPATALADAGGGVSEEELPDLVSLAENGGRRDAAPRGKGGGSHPGEVDVAAAIADMDRWIFMSDVCKHCTNAGCMDACPTGALVRTEFETVILQSDVCNGCGYCVPSCPFGVVDRDHDDGRASKCTLCYDRLEDGLEPACAKACPRTPSSSARTTSSWPSPAAASPACTRRAWTARTSTARATRRASRSPAASARSSCSPSRPSATGCPPTPTRRSSRTSCRRRSRRSAPGSPRRPASPSRSCPPRTAGTRACSSRPWRGCPRCPTRCASCAAGGAS